ncbi:unnamed protein product [Pedinophyceae sp. YPF-701]|nr:unnamed protein product [Pedinophyceae sp. YPF-701]
MTGLRIGLCGSLTTFAAWQAGLIIAIHGNTWSFLEGLGEVFLAQGAGVCAPYLFLALGRKIAQLLPATSDRAGIRTVPEVRPVATAPAGGRSQDLPGASGASHGQFDGVVVFAGPALALALWECVCVLNGSKPADPTGRLWAWSLIFAPIGAMIRWRLASSNKAGRIPWGTFTANIVATSVACLCFGALASAVVGSNVIPAEERIILSAIAIGFCGSLSTVSTLLTEVQAMRQGRQAGGKKGGGMRYLLLSLTTALVAGNFFFELGSISGTSLIKSLGTIVVLSLKYLFSFL